MKKIPTLFTRKFENHKVVGISPEVTEGMGWVLNGEGIATVKIDGRSARLKDQTLVLHGKHLITLAGHLSRHLFFFLQSWRLII